MPNKSLKQLVEDEFTYAIFPTEFGAPVFEGKYDWKCITFEKNKVIENGKFEYKSTDNLKTKAGTSNLTVYW